MPRRLTHGRLGLLRQLVHARCPLLVADLALGTARLWGEERGRRGEHAHCSSLISRSERRARSVRSSTTSSKGVHQGQPQGRSRERLHLLGAKLNDQSLALLRDLHAMGGEGQSACNRGKALGVRHLLGSVIGGAISMQVGEGRGRWSVTCSAK